MSQLASTTLSFELDWEFVGKASISFALLGFIVFLLKRLQRQHDVDFKHALETISRSIEERRTAIIRLRKRQERFTKLLIQYALLFWLAYAILWYRGALPTEYDRRLQKLPRQAQLIPLAFEPVVCTILLVAIKAWYAHRSNVEEKHLQLLLKERDATLNELKETSGFHHTVKILELYGDQPSKVAAPSQDRKQPVPPTTPRPPITTVSLVTGPPQPLPIQPYQRQWYDRLADLILGEDPEASESPFQKFALICERCHSHNGLVKEAVFDNLQFLCRNCNHMNPSYASRLRHPTAPTNDDMEDDRESISSLESAQDSETESIPEENSS